MRFFTLPLGTLPTGTYDWRIKGPAYLSTSGTFTLTAGVNSVEMGLQKAGDISGDNVVNSGDFNSLRTNFGQGGAPPIRSSSKQ